MKMKISHKSLGVCLRIFYCFSLIFSLFTFVYQAFFRRDILYTVLNVFYFPIVGAILYLLFARQHPPKRFGYGTFLALCLLDVAFLIGTIYHLTTMVSQMTKELFEHLVNDKPISPGLESVVTFNKCCAIDAARNTNEYFSKFQNKFSQTCSDVQQSDAESCVSIFQSQRNLFLIVAIFTWIFRLIILLLLGKYIRDEYKDDKTKFSSIAADRSTTSSVTFNK